MTRRLYAGKDFATGVAEVKSRLQRKFPEIQFDFANDLQVVIMEVVGYFAENVNFFQDLQAAEGYTETAQLGRSIQRISSFSAYNPPGAVPASGTISVSLSEVQTTTVQLAQGQGWTGSNGLRYESTDEVLYTAGELGPKDVSLSQRETRSVIFRSKGTRFQRFALDVRDGEYLAYQSLEVLVDNVEWEESDAFLDTDSTVFRAAYTGEPAYIEFGDGAVGEIPQTGAEIAVTYRVTAGIAGALTTPGNITGPTPGIVAGGNPIAVVIDEATGIMSGGQGPEDAVVSKAKIPLAEHSDQAVVVHPDFSGLVSRYRDPVFGAIAAATAVVATSIENDLFSVQSLGRMRGLFTDASDVVDSSAVALRQVQADVDAALDVIDGLADDIVTLSELGGDIRTEMVNIRGQKGAAQTSVNSANSDVDAIESILAGMPVAADGLTDPTRASLTASLTAITSSLTSIKTQLAAIETASENTDGHSEDVETKAAETKAQVVVSKTETAQIETQVVVLETELIDPWDDAIAEIDALEAHLDDIFADTCGPNVVSVPILVRDSDGFYTAPSIGLQRALEAWLEDRKEPSVIFRVVDGSVFLVVPSIEIVFEPLAGEVPTEIKAAQEAAILTLMKGLDFGEALYLDDLYNQLRPIGRVISTNVTITSFTAATTSQALIDGEGNLVVEDREIVNEPVLSFFRRFSDGSKGPI